VLYIADFEAITERLLMLSRAGDVIITQGAGSVWKIGEEYLQKAAAKG